MPALLDRVDFGKLAAEREVDRLALLFISSQAYERFRDGRKIIALGNRGSGKTALLSMLAGEARRAGHVVIELVPEDYGYELLKDTIGGESAGAWHKHGAYAAAWKNLLYLQAMKAVTAAQPGLKTGPAKRIYTYLRDHYANVEVGALGALISYLKRLEGVKIGKYEAAAKARELQRLYALEDVAHLLDDLNEICAGSPVLFIVDELDRGWDGSEDAVAFVAGLFQAATSISARTPHLRVVMSLRRELYDNIPSLYEDAQKVRDTIEVLHWNEERLRDLISRRIRFSLELPPATPADAAWRQVFPATIDGQDSFQHILALTLFRPRELIHLCNEIVASERDRDGGLPVSTDSVAEATAVYSHDRFQDIVAEHRSQLPGLASVLETFRGLPAAWDRPALEEHLLAINVGEVKVDAAAAWCVEGDADQVLEALWRVGFLMVEAAGADGGTAGAGRSGGFVGSHQARTINLHNARRFRVHPMFANHLGCA